MERDRLVGAEIPTDYGIPQLLTVALERHCRGGTVWVAAHFDYCIAGEGRGAEFGRFAAGNFLQCN